MKKTRKIFFSLIALAAICLSYGSSYKNINIIVEKDKSDFEKFTNLFYMVKLPLTTDTLKCSKNSIPKELAEKFIFPNDAEANKAGELKSAGKFKISDNYIGILYCYSTQFGEDIKGLMIYNISGNFMSKLTVWIDYRSFSLKSTIDASYNITCESYGRENVEEVSDIESEYYSIKNGIITKKKK
jgi:hypothetical protein